MPGAPQRRAADVVWQFFRHGVEVMVYIIFVSVIGLAVQRIVADPLPAELGGTNPFAHVLMMGGVAMVAFMLLRHIRADLSGRPRGPRHGAAGHRRGGRDGDARGVRGGGSAAVAGAKGLRRRSGSRGRATPWERLEDRVQRMPPRCTARRSPASTRCLARPASLAAAETRDAGRAQQPAAARLRRAKVSRARI